MRIVTAQADLYCSMSSTGRRALLAASFLSVWLLLTGCSNGGIYANIGIAGPSVDIGPVSVRTGVNIGRWY